MMMANNKPKQYSSILLTGTILLACVAHAAPAAESMENRLREQLQLTTRQLQTVQNDQAKVLAERNAAQGQLQALQQENAQLKVQLGQSKGQVETLSDREVTLRNQAEVQIAASQQQVEKFRGAYDQLLQLARSKEMERLELERRDAQTRQTLAICEQKNQRLYSLGKEVLTAYEGLGTGNILQMRQPFATASRVKFEEIAQSYGDHLYENRADAHGTLSTTETATQPSGKQE